MSDIDEDYTDEQDEYLANIANLECQLDEVKKELARAMRVVEAADTYEANLDDEALLDLWEVIREWKAGR